METLHGEQVILRPASIDDIPRFVDIVQAPEVHERWGDVPAEEFAADMADEDGCAYAIEVEGAVAGLIQFSEETDRRYHSASIDIFLAPEFHRRGLGPDAIRTLVRYLIEVRGHHRVTIDPAADNHSAISAYAKVGFRPVGIMRQYERIPTDEWHDNLLMDLVADDWSAR